MKGTDCTPEQIASADAFLAGAGWRDEANVRVSREDIVRCIAWYGALRFIAARDGVGGTLEVPGEFVRISKPPRPSRPPQDTEA